MSEYESDSYDSEDDSFLPTEMTSRSSRSLISEMQRPVLPGNNSYYDSLYDTPILKIGTCNLGEKCEYHPSIEKIAKTQVLSDNEGEYIVTFVNSVQGIHNNIELLRDLHREYIDGATRNQILEYVDAYIYDLNKLIEDTERYQDQNKYISEFSSLYNEVVSTYKMYLYGLDY